MDTVLGNDYQIINIEKKDNKMILLGVDKLDLEKTEDEIVNDIILQNGLKEVDVNMRDKLKIIRKFISKNNSEVGNIILGIKNDVFKFFEKVNKLFIGFNSCKVEKYVNVVRCYNCWRYSHKKAYCKFNKTCGICTGNHDVKDCPNDKKECINCMSEAKRNKTQMNTNHTSFDKSCPCYIKLLEKIKNKPDSEK